jgi:streptogramin lyase
VADPCLPFPRNRHCVPTSEMDQSNGFRRELRPRRAGGRPGLAGYLACCVVVALGVALSACGSGGGSRESAVPNPSADAPVVVGGTPVAVAVGAGGVWVADNSGSRVIELDPANGRPVGKPIPVAAGPEAIAVGEGGVWIASGDGTVTRVDPGTGKPRRAPARVADPGGIAAGEGAVWVTSRARGTVTRIDPNTLNAVADPIPVGAGPADVAVGAGAAWVANTDDGTVTRIDASSGAASDPIAVADYQVLGLCFGEDGVWAAKTDDRLARTIDVVRIDPSSSAVGDEAARVPAAIPVRLAAGEGGVWATLVGGIRPPASEPRPGQVALLDPASLDRPAQVVRVGDRPAGIATGEGAVWVADSGSGSVTRIDL